MMEALLNSKPCVSFEFEVEKVIGVSNDGNFQVQWAPAWVSKFHLVGCEHLIQEFLKEQSAREVKPEPESLYELCEDIATEMEGNPCERTEEILQQEWNYSPSLETSTNSVEVGVQSTLLKDDTHKSENNVQISQLELNNSPTCEPLMNSVKVAVQSTALEKDTHKIMETSDVPDIHANHCLKFMSLMEHLINSPTLLKKDNQDLVTNPKISLAPRIGLVEELVEPGSSPTNTRTSSLLAAGETVVSNEVSDNRFHTETEKEKIDEPHIYYKAAHSELGDGPGESICDTTSQLSTSAVEVNGESSCSELNRITNTVKQLPVSCNLEELGDGPGESSCDTTSQLSASAIEVNGESNSPELNRITNTVKQFPVSCNLEELGDGPGESSCDTTSQSSASAIEVNGESNSPELNRITKTVKQLPVLHNLEVGTVSIDTPADEQDGPYSQVSDTQQLRTTSKQRENRHSCTVCEKRFSTAVGLSRHFRIHTEKKQYKCPHCNKSFTLKSHLEQHIKVHAGANLQSSTQSVYTYSTRSKLTRHMGRRTSEKPFAREHCFYSCKPKNDPTKHLHSHAKESFSCNQCSYSSMVKRDFERHVCYHTGERPHACDQCKFRFVTKSDLSRHIRTHTGKKPYSCKVCGKSFGRGDTRNKHVRRWHKYNTTDGGLLRN